MYTAQIETLSTDKSRLAEKAFFPSSEVYAVFERFNRSSDETHQLAPRTDISKILHDFAHQHANDAVYEAAQMIDLADRLDNGLLHSSVVRSLSPYMEAQDNPDKQRYVTSILADVETMNTYIKSNENAFFSDQSPSAIRIRSAIDYTVDADIPYEVWDNDTIPPDLKTLANLAESVNLEAVLVKSAQMLQLLKNPITPPKERLRTVLAIESTYAPLCELSGFDALAATMLSEASCARLAMSGNQHYIDKAYVLLEAMGDIQCVEDFVAMMPAALIGDSDHEAIIDNAAGYGVYFSHSHSDAEALVNQEDSYIDIVSRIKTIGSIARKLQYHDRKGHTTTAPADVIGMTVIADDIESIELLLNDVMRKLKSIEGLTFVAAPSREQELQIKGSQEFRATMTAITSSVDPNLTIKPEPHDGGFEAVKITVSWPNKDRFGTTHVFPVEIQITHRESRNNARVGLDSHTLFKLRKYGGAENIDFLNSPEAVECLKRIRARKDKLLENIGYGMNKHSRKHSETLHDEITFASPAYELGNRAYQHSR